RAAGGTGGGHPLLWRLHVGFQYGGRGAERRPCRERDPRNAGVSRGRNDAEQEYARGHQALSALPGRNRGPREEARHGGGISPRSPALPDEIPPLRPTGDRAAAAG